MPHRATFAAAVLRIVLVLTLGATSAALGQESRRDQAKRELGADLVSRNCGMCHATGRTGASALAQAPAFRDLHRRYAIEALSEALAEGILTGHPSMPEFRFTPAEIAAIIDYLQSIQSRQSTSAG